MVRVQLRKYINQYEKIQKVVFEEKDKEKRIDSWKKELSLLAESLIQNHLQSLENNFDESKFKSESLRQDLGKILRDEFKGFKKSL